MKWFFLATGLGMIACEGCQVKGNGEESRTRAIELPVIRLSAKDTVLEQLYVTDIHAIQNVQVRAKVPGYIDDILVDEGRPVRKGQLLFVINDAEFQSDLARARAGLAQAQAEARSAELELERIRLLVEKKVIARSEAELGEARLKLAEAKVEESRNAVERSRIHLSYTLVRAPFDGIIDRIPLKRGSLVGEGDLLTSISDLKAMYAYFKFSEQEYLHYIKLKQEHREYASAVELVLADGSPYPWKGEVETMESEFDGSTGSIALRARFPNPDQLLKHGSTGKIRLKTEVEKVIIIPQKAVLEIQDKNYVLLMGKENIVRMKDFRPGTRIGEFIIVQSGLQPDDVIVYEGVQSVRDGTRISPRYVMIDSLVALNGRE